MTKKGIHDESTRLDDTENKIIFDKVEETKGIVRQGFYLIKIIIL